MVSRHHPTHLRLRELFALFVRLGVTGFGGPAAHIAMMRDEVVRRRGWMDDTRFLESVGVVNLIPGPNSTELAMLIGRRRAGGRGLVVAGLSFIVPAVVIVSFFAWAYQRYGTTPSVIGLRAGVMPVIVAIVLHATVGLGRTALRTPSAAVIAAISLVTYLIGVHEVVIIVAAGIMSMLLQTSPPHGLPLRGWIAVPGSGLLAAGSDEATLWRLARVFLEVGSVLYGSGYVLVAFLERRVVHDLGWLTDQQLIDAVAVGQVTPGPVFTTATFVGWLVEGPWGALVATTAIFAPSFVFVAIVPSLEHWMAERKSAKAFLSGVTVASWSLMAGVMIRIAGEAVVDPLTAVIGAGSLIAVLVSRVNPSLLIAVGALIGVAAM